MLRHLAREDAPLASDLELIRWSLIAGPGLDLVIGANRNSERLFGIAVVVANEEREASVGIRVPALERRRDASAALARRIQRQDALRNLCRCGDETAHDEDARQKRPQQLLLLWGFAIRGFFGV